MPLWFQIFISLIFISLFRTYFLNSANFLILFRRKEKSECLPKVINYWIIYILLNHSFFRILAFSFFYFAHIWKEAYILPLVHFPQPTVSECSPRFQLLLHKKGDSLKCSWPQLQWCFSSNIWQPLKKEYDKIIHYHSEEKINILL